jgi:RimJ/RimL family protein N-acetyltransferase
MVEWNGTVVLATPRLLLRTFRRGDGAFLGRCGLHHQQSYPDEVEVAWRLVREHWGQGDATEAATGWLDHGLGALRLPRVISITDPPNLRSLAVMRAWAWCSTTRPSSRTWAWSSLPVHG